MDEQSERLTFDGGTATVDAAPLADGLRLRPDAVPAMLREGSITCRFECGTAEDDGRFRLTFWNGNLRFRVVVDGARRVLQRFRLD
ncbi:MAG: hypothetical protein KF723_03390 [Rhizobiaceae bacterium]|nr:hypothetical protein [Rhizobiaceae bacterium]